MKKRHKLIVIISCGLVFLGISSFICCNLFLTILHLPPTLCRLSLDGVSPDSFCETKGKDTWLEGKYLFADVDRDGCLILILRNNDLLEWRNTFVDLQVLQCVLENTRDIGIEVDYSKDLFHLMETANTCGYEISNDYTRIVESYEDNSWYYPVIMSACMKMQMFEGKTCSDIRVEFLRVDTSGEIVETIVYPDDIENTIVSVD